MTASVHLQIEPPSHGLVWVERVNRELKTDVLLHSREHSETKKTLRGPSDIHFSSLDFPKDGELDR